MLLEAIWSFVERETFKISFPRDTNKPFFNPYCERVSGLDLPGADQIRRENFHNYLVSFTEWPYFLIIGEAPGWRGCRFSGVPFTSEAQLASGALPFSGFQSSLRSSPYNEASATIFWREMQPYHPQFLVWNCIPFHLNKPGEPLSNRSPTKKEIDNFAPLLARLVSLLAPKKVIAVGMCARKGLIQLGIPHVYVRHPAHGGSKEFGARMARILQSPHVEQAKQV